MWPGCVSADQNTLAWHEENQFPLLAWSAQARGFFSGRYSPSENSNRDIVSAFYNAANWERYRRATQLAERKGCHAFHIALAFVLCQPFPIGGIIGSNTVDQLRYSVRAAQVTLTEEEIRWLDLDGDELTP